MNERTTTTLEDRPHDPVSDGLRRQVPAFRAAGFADGHDLADVRRRSQRQRATRATAIAAFAVVLLGAGVLAGGRIGSTATGLETGGRPDATPTSSTPSGTPTSTTPDTSAAAIHPVPGNPVTSDPATTGTTQATTGPMSSTAPSATPPAMTPDRVGVKPILRGDGVGDARFGDRYADVVPKLTLVLGPPDATAGAAVDAERPYVSWGTFALVFDPEGSELVFRSWIVGAGDGPDLVDVRTTQGIFVGDRRADALLRMPGEPVRRSNRGSSPELDWCYTDHGGEICLVAPDASDPADSYVLGLHASGRP